MAAISSAAVLAVRVGQALECRRRDRTPTPACPRSRVPAPRPAIRAGRRARSSGRRRVRAGIRRGSRRRHRSDPPCRSRAPRRRGTQLPSASTISTPLEPRVVTRMPTCRGDLLLAQPGLLLQQTPLVLVGEQVRRTLDERRAPASPSRRASCCDGSAANGMPSSRHSSAVANHRLGVVGADQHQIRRAALRGQCRESISRAPRSSRRGRTTRSAPCRRRWCT